YVLAQPSRKAKRYFVRFELPPKTNNTAAASLCRHVLPLAAPRRRRHCDLHVLARECLRYRLYGETWSTFIGGNRWNYMKNIHPLLRGYAMRVSDGSCRTPALDAGVCLRKFAIVRPQRL